MGGLADFHDIPVELRQQALGVYGSIRLTQVICVFLKPSDTNNERERKQRTMIQQTRQRQKMNRDRA